MDNFVFYKFQHLPQAVQDKASSPEVISEIENLEKQYNVDLAHAVMSVLTGDLKVADLEDYLLNSSLISFSDARKLKLKLISNVLNQLPVPQDLPAQQLAAQTEKPAKVEIENVSKTSEPLPHEQEILSAYRGDEKQLNSMVKLADKIGKKVGDSSQHLYELFYRSVQNKDLNKTLAVLRVLAQKNLLAEFLQVDKRLNQFMFQIWQKQYGQNLADEFLVNPTKIKFVRLFLRYVLEQRLNLPTEQAARYGAQIGGILVNQGKKEYNKMAYFDVNKQQFSWFE